MTRIRNFGWNRLKLATLSYEEISALEEQVKQEHACSDGIHMYDKAGRDKLDALSWAVYNKQAEAGGRPMSNIDKHAVQAVADLKAGYRLGHADVAILNELARIALASLEAEPVAAGYCQAAAQKTTSASIVAMLMPTRCEK